MLWTEEQLLKEFHHHHLDVYAIKEINDGRQIILRGGSIVNIYSTGRTQVQGKAANSVEKDIVIRICNGQKSAPKVYLLLSSDKNANDQLESKLSSAEIPFESSNTNPLLI